MTNKHRKNLRKKEILGVCEVTPTTSHLMKLVLIDGESILGIDVPSWECTTSRERCAFPLWNLHLISTSSNNLTLPLVKAPYSPRGFANSFLDSR
jgi:hypothetical protein